MKKILKVYFGRLYKDYLKFLQNENNDIENKTKSRNKMKLLNNLKLKDIRGKIINTNHFHWNSLILFLMSSLFRLFQIFGQ
jgi:hypothetical protein